MGFGMFSVHQSPIAIDFGSASVKLLQLGGGDRPALLAAAELPIPDPIRADNDRIMAYLDEWIPVMLRDGKFKSRKAIISVPASQTFVQHMQITEENNVSRDDLIKGQLQTQMGCSPHGVVVRSTEVCNVHRNGQPQKEMICFAIAKDVVMKYVQMLTKCKLEVTGVHTDTLALVRAFDHLHRRSEDDDISTLYIDMGWGGTRAAITHGKQVVFSRQVPVGGKHFDQLIASVTQCDLSAARSQRLSLHRSTTTGSSAAPGGRERRAGGNTHHSTSGATTATAERPGDSHTKSTPLAGTSSDALRQALNVDASELLDTITDELSMCLRYHHSLFAERPINRAIFVGGESRQAWLCQHIVKALRVPAQLGDPLARMDSTNTPPTPNLKLGQPHPGWAVACGLATVQAG